MVGWVEPFGARRPQIFTASIWVPIVALAITLCSCSDAPSPNTNPELQPEIAQPETEIDDATLEQLQSIGYLSGYSEQPEDTGATIFDEARAQPGLNLYTSGHSHAAYLIDMQGVAVHTWEYDASDLFPINSSRDYWRRVHLNDRGDLYACVDPHGIIKLNKNSELIWNTNGEDLLHHDFFVDETENVYAIGRRIGPIPDIDPTKDIIDDTVVLFDTNGNRIKRFSVFDAFRDTEWFDRIAETVGLLLDSADPEVKRVIEAFHTNTIEVFDGSLASVSPLLKAGNAILCSPIHRNVFIVDLEQERVVWNWFGPWKAGIHQPTFLKNGNFLLFDNNMHSNDSGETVSQTLEYTFPDTNQVWEYSGIAANREYYSRFSSLAERLPNGNTLVVVSNEGRAIEVTPSGEVVWEFWNPNTVDASMRGQKGFAHKSSGEIIGTLFQLERVSLNVQESWL